MKIAGWIFFGIGVVLLIGTLIGYFTAQGPIGEAGVGLMSGLGVSAVPLVIGLVLLSKAQERDKAARAGEGDAGE